MRGFDGPPSADTPRLPATRDEQPSLVPIADTPLARPGGHAVSEARPESGSEFVRTVGEFAGGQFGIPVPVVGAAPVTQEAASSAPDRKPSEEERTDPDITGVQRDAGYSATPMEEQIPEPSVSGAGGEVPPDDRPPEDAMVGYPPGDRAPLLDFMKPFDGNQAEISDAESEVASASFLECVNDLLGRYRAQHLEGHVDEGGRRLKVEVDGTHTSEVRIEDTHAAQSSKYYEGADSRARRVDQRNPTESERALREAEELTLPSTAGADGEEVPPERMQDILRARREVLRQRWQERQANFNLETRMRLNNQPVDQEEVANLRQLLDRIEWSRSDVY